MSTLRSLPDIQKHYAKNDWCHLCGFRSNLTASIHYPENAEHALMRGEDYKGNEKYIRICAICAENIKEIAGEE